MRLRGGSRRGDRHPVDRGGRHARWFALAAVCLLVVASAPAVAVTATGSGPSEQPGDAAVSPPPRQTVDADAVDIRVELAGNGTAVWQIRYRTRLATDNDTAAFEAFAADVSANESAYERQFGSRMRRSMRAAENETGREMAITDVSVATDRVTIPREYGVVTYRFRWQSFAAVEDGEVRAGDAIAGFVLDADTSLTMTWPDGYEPSTVRPNPDARDESAVTWNGRATDFGPAEPRVVVRERAGTGLLGGLGLAGLAVLVFLFLVGIAGVAVLAYRSEWVGGGASASEPDSTSSSAPPGDGSPTESSSEPAEESDGQPTASSPPPELLSNEEQVLQVLEAADGRIKQQALADRLAWTDAKTSKVVGELRDDDAIETFRIGRENVVTLPDVGVEPDDPGAAGNGDVAGDDSDGAGDNGDGGDA